MAQRVTKAALLARIKRMQDQGMDVSLQEAYGMGRIETQDGKHDLSPRMPRKMLWEWLDAFYQGWGAHAFKGVSNANKPQ